MLKFNARILCLHISLYSDFSAHSEADKQTSSLWLEWYSSTYMRGEQVLLIDSL